MTELFIRGRKLPISLDFITQFYFTVPKNIRLNSTHYFVMEIPNKRELYKMYTAKPYSFLIIASDNSLHFRENLLERI